ncbi:peptidase M4, thermolysin [Cordyceps javanica]|uniref:Peptidase M4, thermolysin n=1 Tax=Cordyceps javanica TaxID=43265 RepID=A0A545W625_9HYPO|nr:peptidase M4, thermolysin [Cordyceps javanica]TQW09416.1 peptidase M4, thermolysin [Cordyceps javanica]
MCDQRCYIVPPHLLQAIADSTSNPEKIRESARACLLSREKVSTARKELFATLAQPRGFTSQQRHQIVPPHVFQQMSTAEANDEETRARAKGNLEHVEGVIAQYKTAQGNEQEAQSLSAQSKSKKETRRAVYDAQNTTSESSLPGKLVRDEGQGAVKDKAVNEAFDNVGSVLKFYQEKFKWASIDNRRADVISSVHFGEAYENAFWDPSVRQMVFGDGGEFLNNFTASIDVIGHELTHAVTEHTSPLDYQGQPGALNEHVSDVFGIMVKQMVEDEKSDVADWLIGENCILPGIKGTALRSMKEPGTAYDDPRFGKDPQVSNMKDFKQMYEDNGGVHIFSGIPNKAFYLAAVALGGYSWEKAGQIWWKTMNSGKIPTRCTFLQFADVTVDVAEEEFKAGKIVRKAWDDEGPNSDDGCDNGRGNDHDNNDGDNDDDNDDASGCDKKDDGKGKGGDCDKGGDNNDDSGSGDCGNGKDGKDGKDGKGGKGGKDCQDDGKGDEGDGKGGKGDNDEGDCGCN